MWNSIVSVPDRCIFINFKHAKIEIWTDCDFIYAFFLTAVRTEKVYKIGISRQTRDPYTKFRFVKVVNRDYSLEE